MNEKILKELIIDTINTEKHLGENLKKQCLEYFEDLQQENKQLKEENKSILKDLKVAEAQLNLHKILVPKCKYDEVEQQRDLYKSIIEEIKEWKDKNRTRYIYQDGLGEDWWFEDLDVYAELKEILDKANLKESK